MRLTIIISLALLTIGCGSGKPKNSIPEEQFIDILVDVHMIDALATDYTINSFSGNLDSIILYSSVMNKYNTTKADFDSTLKWYSSNPERMAKVFDVAFGKINKINQNIENDLASFDNGLTNEVFKTEKYIDTRGDTTKYPQPFYVQIDSNGKYLVDIKIRMLESDKSINPLILGYWIDNKESPTDSTEVFSTPISKSNYSRDYQYIFERTSEQQRFLKIIVPQIDNKTNSFAKNLQISSLRVLIVKDDSESDS